MDLATIKLKDSYEANDSAKGIFPNGTKERA